MMNIGTRVKAHDPKWQFHGCVGTVVKVNRVTIRVRLDGHITDVIGSPVYFKEA